MKFPKIHIVLNRHQMAFINKKKKKKGNFMMKEIKKCKKK